MQHWTEEITPKTSLLDLKLKEVWHYRDLMFMFVKRDFVTFYKQTILGPLWFFVQPLLTTIMYVIVFGNIAKISTDGLPPILFYLCGITFWNYFSECFTKTSTVFKDNANMFGKVYFPRLVMPLSIVFSGLIKLSIQFLLFVLLLLWYMYQDSNVHPNLYILLTPYLVILMAVIALGAGMIISSLTTKYKDLIFLITFGIQLLMYATPVIYPISSLPEKYAFIIKANPLSAVIETFRFAFTGSGTFSWMHLGYSSVFAFALLAIGAIIFNKVEKTFMDTV